MNRLIAAVALTLTLGTPGPAQAVLACEFSATLTFTPGISDTPGTGTFATSAPGSITCEPGLGTGTVTGSGTYGTGPSAEVGGETCALGSGHATLTLTFPAGTTTGQLDFVRVNAAGTFTGSSAFGDLRGAFTFTPVVGDCSSAPVTQATISGRSISN